MPMSSTKPHVALLASPGMGHLIPVLELAKRFVSLHNFKLTVFVVAADHASLTHSQLIRSPYPDLLDIVILPFVDVSNMVGPDASIATKIVVMMSESMLILRSEISKMEFRPTALVVDLFGTAAFGIADEFNMLKYSFIASNAWFTAVLLYSPEIDRKEVDEHVKNKTPLHLPLPGSQPIKFEDTMECFLLEGEEYQRYLSVGIRMSSSDGILVNSWDELEFATIKALKEAKKVPIYPIGPVVRGVEKPFLGHEVLEWLENQPKESVIYVSFGSGGTLTAHQLTELAWGLELSDQRFVWVVRPPAENDASVSFFSVGKGADGSPDYLPDGFFSRTKDRGFVVPMWVPQVEVLRHPSVGGFFTHCGWNSVMESVVHGVPMIALPLYAEQKLNATMLTEEIGASVRVKAGESPDAVVGREEIKRMVRRILVDDEGQHIRNKVKELKNDAAKTLKEGVCSHNSLAQVAEILIQHLNTKAYGA